MAKNKQYVLVTGSGGLIGSESVHFFCEKGFNVIGIDNNMREYYFGEEGSTKGSVKQLINTYKNYEHYSYDIRDARKIENLFKRYKFNLIIHAAAQPSHDWAAREPLTDFEVNAVGTINILENFRKYSPKGVFIFTSTNKVYGDTPNKLPLVELKKRYEITSRHKYKNGIDESMSIDDSTHSLFGVSKASADLMVQEYGKYFNLYTAVFRGGCLTGSRHASTQLHGFLSYLVKCILTGKKYTIFGYKGKQVRDNIHSHDLVNAFYHFYLKPRVGEVYNIGGSRYANISMLEAIEKIEKVSGKKAQIEYIDENRKGDHIWYISSVEKFKSHYPNWDYEYDIDETIWDICKNSDFAKDIISFSVARDLDHWRNKNWYFHNTLKEIFKSFVPEDSKVLQVGYGLGDILAAMFPKTAVSVDNDESIILSASKRYPHIKFLNADISKLSLREKFDYVIFPNSVEYLYDVQAALENVKKYLNKDSNTVITSVNPRWEQLFYVLEKLKLKRPELPKNWFRLEDLKNIVEVSGYEVTETGFKILLPIHVPLLSGWVNKLSSRFCVEQYLVAKPKEKSRPTSLTCSVVIPCFNEADNIKKCVNSVPKMGKRTEIIVVDDGSTDETAGVVRKLMTKNRNLKLISYKPNHGKGYAVKRGFDSARGDVVMILDADMAVPVSELPRFFNLLSSKEAGFVNGTRLIYPMEDQAMRQLNLIGNLIFGWIFSWILNQRITDTLCGTKALFKKDYLKIKMGGESWGDFDLLFGAAENNLKIVEMPVHYKRRVAGKSKMKALQHGMVLAKMCFVGWWRLKAVPLFSKSKRGMRKRIK